MKKRVYLVLVKIWMDAYDEPDSARTWMIGIDIWDTKMEGKGRG